MIKKIYLLAITAMFMQRGLAADEPLRHYVSIGIGAPNLPKYYFNKFDFQNKFKAEGTGPFHLKYENRIKPWLGIGLSVNHMTYKISYTDNATDTVQGIIVPNNIEISNNNTAFNFRTNFHFINPEKYDKLDVYFGLGIGFKVGKLRVSSDYEGYTPSFKLPSINKFGFETSLGMRYFFDKHIGLYTEIGIAKSIIQFGLTTRF